MFSKVLKAGVWRSGTALAIALGAAACAVNEGPPPEKVKEVKNTQLGCLGNFRAEMVDYFQGKSDKARVLRVAECADQAIRAFGELTRGEDKNKYTAAEVRNFLQRYFLRDFTVTDELLQEFMILKKGLLGGKTSDFTYQDLMSAQKLIYQFADQLIILQPYMPLGMDDVKKLPPEKLDAAMAALQTVAKDLSDIIQEKNTVYSLSDLDRLFAAIIEQFPNADTLKKLRTKIDLAGSLKLALISPDRSRDEITAEEWKVILQDGAAWLSVFMRVYHVNENYDDWLYGKARERMTLAANDALDLMKRVVSRYDYVDTDARGARRVSHIMPFTAIDDLLDALPWEDGFMGFELKKSTVKTFLPAFFRRFFGGLDTSIEGRQAPGLTQSAIERMRVTLNDWMEGLRFGEGLYAVLGGAGRPLAMSTGYADAQLLSVPIGDAFARVGGMTAAGERVAKDLRVVLSTTPPLLFGDNAWITFYGNNEARPRTFRDFSQYAWIRSLFRQIVLGYLVEGNPKTRSGDPSTMSMTLGEFTTFVRDIWPLLLEYRLVGPRNDPVSDAKKRFREANLFSYVANGDAYIDVNEGAQLLTFMLSSAPLSRKMRELALAQGCRAGPPDDYGETTIEPKCFRRVILNPDLRDPIGKQIWAGFPLLLSYYQSLTAADRPAVMTSLEVASRKNGENDVATLKYMDSDTDTMAMMLHYVENVFMRFDRNLNGSLNYDESVPAYEVFKRELSALSGIELPTRDKKRTRLNAVFTWLLKYGEPPNKKKIGQILKFLKWQKLDKWDFACDRRVLLNVFATLSNMTAGSVPSAPAMAAAMPMMAVPAPALAPGSLAASTAARVREPTLADDIDAEEALPGAPEAIDDDPIPAPSGD